MVQQVLEYRFQFDRVSILRPHFCRFIRSLQSNMQVIVKPISASLTHDTETFTRMDPYCVVMIGAQRRQTPVCNEGGKQPFWHEVLTFDGVDSPSLIIQLFDKDNLSNDLIGEGIANLSGCMGGIGQNLNVILSYKGKPAGTVNLFVQCQGMGGGFNNQGNNGGYQQGW